MDVGGEKKKHKKKNKSKPDNEDVPVVTGFLEAGDAPLEENNKVQKRKKKRKHKFIDEEKNEETSEKRMRADEQLTETSTNEATSKKKKKKRKHDDSETEHNDSLTLQTSANEATPKKKKKKHKHDGSETEHNDSLTLQISANEANPKKKKKKHKHDGSETERIDTITLKMLRKKSSVLVNELSELKQGTVSSEQAMLSEQFRTSNETTKSVKEQNKMSKSTALLEDPNDSADVDGDLQTKRSLKNQNEIKEKGKTEENKKKKRKKKKEDESKDIEETESNYDDSEVQLWLSSLENDMCEDELDFEPPELHTKFPSLKWMTIAEKEEHVNQGNKLRIGRWSHKEDTILRGNLERFVQKYGVPSIPVVLGINKYAKGKQNPNLMKYLHRKKFLFYIGKDLNDRSLNSVYLRARRIFHPMKGKLSPEQLSQAFRIQARVGNRWNTISELMNKPNTVLYEAVRYHSSKGEVGQWTAEENEKLVAAVKKKLRIREDGTCKKLPWKRISEKVGTRNSHQCLKQWLHNLCWKFTHGEETKPKWTDEDSLRLIQHLFNYEAESEADLDWNDVFTKFSNVASYSELHYKWYCLKTQVPDYKKKDLEDILLFLEKKFQEKNKQLKNKQQPL